MKMKTMFKLPQLFGAVLLISCTTSELPPDNNAPETTPRTNVVIDPSMNTTNNTTDILPSLYPFGNQTSFIKGQVSVIANTANVSSFMTTRMATPDMGNILKTGEKLNMVAMGGGMTAGVRNGGLYRYGQMTAYPNLVARQMGMTDFQTPLFAENEANGTGYLQLMDDGTQYPSWKEVNNNKANVKAGSPPELAKYTGGIVNNYALPGGGLGAALQTFSGGGENIYGRSWFNEQVYIGRMMPLSTDMKNVSLANQITKQPINFYILEDDSDGLISMIRDNFSITSLGTTKANLGYSYSIDNMIVKMKDQANTTKGVVFTWPVLSDLAYFNWYTLKDLKEKANTISIIANNGYSQDYTIDGNTKNVLFNPTPTIDALFRNLKKGDNVSLKLLDRDILDPWEYSNNIDAIRTYNNYIRTSAKKSGLALVDLEKLYGRIHANTYISDDGFRIDGSPKGNFFSSDGIYPTAVGQSVIANEVIKSINATYKSNIPLINLKEYSLSVGKE
jgi:hypothetical protein